MPIIRQKFIRRADLQAHPDRLYVFGDNHQRKGLGGQAREMRGEPNAVGIVTKWTPSTVPAAYFDDRDYDKVIVLIDRDLQPIRDALAAGKTVVLPEDGIGTGLARLAESAPRINAWLQSTLAAIESDAS